MAGGVWGTSSLLARSIRRLRSDGTAMANRGAPSPRPPVAGVCAWGLVVMLGFTNLRTYFATYQDNLPYGNTPVAGSIVRYARTLPTGTEVHLVGFGWAERMPEPKSVAHQLGPSRPLVEHAVEDFDCADVEALTAGSASVVVVWSPDATAPSPATERCSNRLEPVRHQSPSGRPLFNAAVLP